VASGDQRGYGRELTGPPVSAASLADHHSRRLGLWGQGLAICGFHQVGVLSQPRGRIMPGQERLEDDSRSIGDEADEANRLEAFRR
jgi:hypothetical protein